MLRWTRLQSGVFLFCFMLEVIGSEGTTSATDRSILTVTGFRRTTAVIDPATETSQLYSADKLSVTDTTTDAYKYSPKESDTVHGRQPKYKQAAKVGPINVKRYIDERIIAQDDESPKAFKDKNVHVQINPEPTPIKEIHTQQLNFNVVQKETPENKYTLLNGNNDVNVFTNERNDTGLDNMNFSEIPAPAFLRNGPDDYVNSYRCGHCVCSLNLNKRLTADCTDKETEEIPSDLPQLIWSLDMSGNNITHLSFSNLQYYPLLNHFKISCGAHLKRVETISLESSDRMLNIEILDLSNNQIQSIDNASFIHFPLLRNLTLRGNLLKEITNLTFFGLRNLLHLDLSANVIKEIDIGAFQYFNNLISLDISCNVALGYSTQKLHPLLFSPLNSLTELFIHGVAGRRDSVYPNTTFVQMPHLQRLSVDGLNTEFGPEWLTLKNLQHLEIGSNQFCKLQHIAVSFFENVPFLKRLDLMECNSLSYINPAAFSKVNLQTLTLQSLPNYDLYEALQVLIGLQNSSLTVLRLVHLYNNTFVCKTLREDHAKFLSNLTLEVLDLSDNFLIYISSDFIDLLPKSINKLILRDNSLTSYHYSLSNFTVLYNLSMLDISNQNMKTRKQMKSYECPKVKEKLDKGTGSCRKIDRFPLENSKQTSQNVNELFEGIYTPQMSNSEDNIDLSRNRDISHDRDCDANSPMGLDETTNHNASRPRLKIIKASYFNGFGASIILQYQQLKLCLSYLDIYNSFFSTVYIGKFPLPKSIKKALMGSNYIKQINIGFFPKNNLLEKLDIHDNILGPSFALDANGTIFDRLEKLLHLDIRMNFISVLPKHFFQGLVKLQWLRLSNNSLQLINTRFSNQNDLKYIDLSDNAIIWISKEVRDDLDRIALLHPLYIDLTNNSLPCTCNMLDVLHWMEGTKVVFINKDILRCRFDDGTEDRIGNMTVRLRTLQRWCATKSIIIVISVASMAVIGVIVGFALLYRFRWRLRYIRYNLMAKLDGFKPKATLDNGFKFDAYLLYTEETRKFVIRDCVRELEEKRGHNLCFEDRNFMPGSPIVTGIVSAVNNSHKTVPVVTPEFYEGDFSEYGVKMAVMEEIFKKRLALHLCIYQPTPNETMSCDFLVAMKRNDFTEYPHDQGASEEIIQNFWDQLSLVIGHTRNNENNDSLVN